nr:decarboxylase tropj [Quercus suber]
MPPALVESESDLIEYYVDGSNPVEPAAKKGYSERYIHGELFKRYPSIQCVVHSHAEAVLPYVSSKVPMKPMFHMGGFLGSQIPVWDITAVYDDEHYQQDMLVNNEKLGASLASAFSISGRVSLDKNVVLMNRHGYTTWGKDIPSAVYRAIYTLINAGVQTNAMLLQAASKDDTPVEGLSERHCQDCQQMNEATQDKSWRLWTREVGVSPVYNNAVPAPL